MRKSGDIVRVGKLSEAVLRRAVLRPLGIILPGRETYGPDGAVLQPFGIALPGREAYETDGAVLRQPGDGQSWSWGEDGCGRDGAVFAGGGPPVYTAVCAAPGFERAPGALVTAAANNLAAAGAAPEGLLLHAVIPCGYEEALLHGDMCEISARARAYGMRVIGGHTEVSDAVSRPLYSLTGIGRARDGGRRGRAALTPGQDLILTKWIALAGTAAFARAHEEELLKRFPLSLVENAKNFETMMSVLREAETAAGLEGSAMHDLSQGGVFGALWEMAEHAKVGLEVDLRRIPIRQETVEICEYLKVNPYCLYSAGALLIGTDRGEELMARLAEEGIPSALIGHVTSGRERILRNGEEVRYLDRPQQDEWYRRREARLCPV